MFGLGFVASLSIISVKNNYRIAGKFGRQKIWRIVLN